jgi:glutathione S-transferase
MLTIHGYSPSGNCHKLRMLLAHLGRRPGVDYRWIETDSAHGATRTPAYLAKNPNGRVPMIEDDAGPAGDTRIMVESNAILCWLAEGTPYFAGDAWQRAQTLSWMFFEQYSHEPYIAVARFICGWTPLDSPRRAELPKLRERGHQALAVMDKHLASRDWFSDTGYGIADIALYAYTHCAGEGGFDLSAYPSIRSWLGRVEAQPGFVPMAPHSDENPALIARPS